MNDVKKAVLRGKIRAYLETGDKTLREILTELRRTERGLALMEEDVEMLLGDLQLAHHVEERRALYRLTKYKR